MERFRVVISGGGVAAIEGLLRLRRLVGDDVDIQLLAPNEEFAYRALSVKEPFAMPSSPRFRLRRITNDQDAEWVQDSLTWVDPDAQVVHSADGRELPYDALLVAVGGRTNPAYDHVTTFSDADASTFTGLIQDVEQGYGKSIAFLAPAGRAWPLPLYELALMTAERARSMGFDDLQLSIVTPDVEPLVQFGRHASDTIGRLLRDAGIDVYSGATARVPEARRLQIFPHGVELHPDRMIAMPLITGPAIRGLGGTGVEGFIPIDKHCAVPGAGERVFAAGDATDFPVKHGGLGSQQADTAAVGIARLAGADIEPATFKPIIRGMLLTGGKPLFLVAHVVGGQSFESEVSDQPLWSPVEKVAAEELGPYLAELEARV